nr:toprim domain-containing protein [Pseudomonadota bacterium]
VLVRCHAGCSQTRVIAALRARGLWPDNGRLAPKPARAEPRNAGNNQPGRSDTARTEAAVRIWQAATSAASTPVEIYLRSRGITMAVPSALRFHAGIKHPSGGIWPAMVALVTRGTDGAPLAVHRTFLTHDGNGKVKVEPQRMMLGPCRGGAVRLAPAGDALMVGEGIETCLAAMQATGRPTWAALSTSGLRTLDLPTEVRDVVVLADGDEPGEAAARDAALRWKR